VIIGGVFPARKTDVGTENLFKQKPEPQNCTIFISRYYRWIQAMIFVIEEINQDSNLLPNITLGYRIYDSCHLTSSALEGTMWLITGQAEPVPNYRCASRTPLAAVVGDALSATAIPMATLLGVYRYPQISYTAGADILSDKNQFPSFFRTIADGNIRSRSIAKLLVHFGWTWVGILVEDTDFGELTTQNLKLEIGKTDICIGFSEIVPTFYSPARINYIVDVVKTSSVNAIVIVCADTYIVPLMEEMSRQSITGKIWIVTESSSTSAVFMKSHLARTFSGTIGIATHKANIPGFKEFLLNLHPFTSQNNLYIDIFWEHVFGCKWPNPDTSHATDELETGTRLCTGTEKLNSIDISFLDVSELRFTYNVYNAVYAVAHALHDLYTCKAGEGPFANGTCADIHDFEPWQVKVSLTL
uniref:Receptor ligand binding region domain-containing protein n=1 Tax=Latimeria chalumnae TaxID=7897 RepID=H2ZY58_LATCH